MRRRKKMKEKGRGKKVAIVIVMSVFVLTWLVADYVTGTGFNTTQYISMHVNHSFIGLGLLLLAVIFRKRIPTNIFFVLVGVSIGLMSHDAVRFRELCLIPLPAGGW